MSSVLYIISIYTSTRFPPWFLCVTLSRYSALSHLPHQSPPPCTTRGGVRVRTCRLPLIWVSAIQLSGCYKSAPPCVPLSHTLPPHFPITCPGHESCRQPHLVLKVPLHTHLPHPTSALNLHHVSHCFSLSSGKSYMAVVLLCWMSHRIQFE